MPLRPRSSHPHSSPADPRPGVAAGVPPPDARLAPELRHAGTPPAPEVHRAGTPPPPRDTENVRVHYFAVAAVTLLVAWAGSAFARAGRSWYHRLRLPSWTPPSRRFGLVWTLIYFLAAVSAALALDAAGPALFPMIAALYAVNAFLNLAWPYLFFNRRQIGSATLDAALLAVSVAVLMAEVFPLSAAASVLLAPYLLWSAFASVLSYVIFRRNPSPA